MSEEEIAYAWYSVYNSALLWPLIEGLYAKRELIEENGGAVHSMRAVMTLGFPLDIPGGKRYDNFLDGK